MKKSLTAACISILAFAAHAQSTSFDVGFKDASTLVNGSKINPVVYSEKANDARLDPLDLKDGVLKVSGQVGLGGGSQWAGIGVQLPGTDAQSPQDAREMKTVTFNLASATTKNLRLRLMGNEDGIINSGCYPVFYQTVTPEVTRYDIPVKSFESENWCGPKARTVTQTLTNFTGFEVADIAVQKKATTFLVGSISLHR